MSPAKLHSLHAPPAPVAASSSFGSPSPDNSNGIDPSSKLSYMNSGSTAAADSGANDTRPTTAQSYTSHNLDSTAMDEAAGIQRSTSRASNQGGDVPISRGNTLKKKSSLSRKSSLKRSGSRKSVAAGSIKGVNFHDGAELDEKDFNSAFSTPIPTQSSPTDILANRFQGKCNAY
ncbi:hypothetical protein K461DRAFT_276431 [Myriangium duriaei CBS 260.36]|uniref:Uncharacterized protein n=1 Tax=Myriangium duriaei CBS 260.36 TaxID=1168546 RepID=A0A9P4MHV1_9PEZI|nr:hypothetical protein K461DRAFT_276431 [Myriangium duriaei CBS 260.36]